MTAALTGIDVSSLFEAAIRSHDGTWRKQCCCRALSHSQQEQRHTGRHQKQLELHDIPWVYSNHVRYPQYDLPLSPAMSATNLPRGRR